MSYQPTDTHARALHPHLGRIEWQKGLLEWIKKNEHTCIPVRVLMNGWQLCVYGCCFLCFFVFLTSCHLQANGVSRQYCKMKKNKTPRLNIAPLSFTLSCSFWAHVHYVIGRSSANRLEPPDYKECSRLSSAQRCGQDFGSEVTQHCPSNEDVPLTANMAPISVWSRNLYNKFYL